MDTIRTYVENMFASMPKTAQVLKVKEGLLTSMEDKYNQLKSEGKSENEAVGIVISEFGNIDELTRELGIEPVKAETGSNSRYVSRSEGEEYIAATKRYSWFVAIGVALCIVAGGVCAMVNAIFAGWYLPSGPIAALGRLGEDSGNEFGEMAALFMLLLTIAAGVVFIIIGESNLEKYDYMKIGSISIDPDFEKEINQRSVDYSPRSITFVAIGVALCILSPIVLIISTYLVSGGTSVFAMLATIAAAVIMFIRVDSIEDCYRCLLNKGRKQRKKKRNKTANIISSILWPVTLCIFFIWSFGWHAWSISWIVFPIAGILSGMISGISSAVSGDDEDYE